MSQCVLAISSWQASSQALKIPAFDPGSAYYPKLDCKLRSRNCKLKTFLLPAVKTIVMCVGMSSPDLSYLVVCVI